MYSTHSTKKSGKFTVTEEDMLELVYVRYGRGRLDEEISNIFGFLFLN